jgi:hypothetical protein
VDQGNGSRSESGSAPSPERLSAFSAVDLDGRPYGSREVLAEAPAVLLLLRGLL